MAKTNTPKRQRWTCGAVVKIPLGNNQHAYGQMLTDPEYAFFAVLTENDLAPEEVVKFPVVCRLWVMVNSYSTGRWVKIGTTPIPPALQEPVLRFNQDPIKPEDIRLTYDGINGPLATVDECEGLECAAVWEPHHVEDRLRDHFADVPNEWALSLRPKT